MAGARVNGGWPPSSLSTSIGAFAPGLRVSRRCCATSLNLSGASPADGPISQSSRQENDLQLIGCLLIHGNRRAAFALSGKCRCNEILNQKKEQNKIHYVCGRGDVAMWGTLFAFKFLIAVAEILAAIRLISDTPGTDQRPVHRAMNPAARSLIARKAEPPTYYARNVSKAQKLTQVAVTDKKRRRSLRPEKKTERRADHPDC